MQEEIAQIQQLYNRIPQQLIARFTTTLEDYQLPHQQLQLSSDLDQYALNQLLKDLLEQENLPFFEFIVEGFILRGKLKSHILRHELTAEQTLNVQYIISFPQLEDHKKAQQEDWVSSICLVPGLEGAHAIAASLYSGAISIYTPELKTLGKFTSEEDPLKAVQFIPSPLENTYFCLSGGLGENLNIHLVQINEKSSKSTKLSINSHNGSINSIQVSPGADSHIATGGSEGELNIWQIPQGFEEQGKFSVVKDKKKKKQLNLNVLPKLTTERIHNGTIDCINWINNQQVVTGSSQHSIAITDIVRMERTETFLTRDSVVLSVDSTADKNILSSHEDGQIRLWDRRDSSRPVNTFKAHSKWTSSVQFSKSPNYFASGSYDHTVKVWDLRCSFPLQNIPTQQQKVLAIEWISQKSLASGGSDSAIHLHHAK